MPELALTGCAPIPLAHYLKALGILRLVAESELSDAAVTAFWKDDQFVLNSRFDREMLVEFFLRDYKPTPLIVPWSGGDFFAVNRDKPATTFDETPTAARVIEAILSTEGCRFQNYRKVLRETFKAMDMAGVMKKKDIEGSGGPQRRMKAELLKSLRSSLPDEAVAWMDAAAVVEPDAVAFNALLGGGGGSDGNSHFSDNFMQSLWIALPDFDGQRRNAVAPIAEETGSHSKRQKKPKPECWEVKAVGGGVSFNSRAAAHEALFGTQGIGTRIPGLSPVLFDNTRVGGPNQTTGFEAKAGSNPWDFILMLEGSVLFAGAIGRKLDDLREPSARFPFLFRSSPVGLGSSYLGESSGRELWLPLWSRAATLVEIRALLSEGRVEKHGRMAKRGTDAFVAAAQLGFDRGISAFQRVGFFKGRIGGDNYFTAVDQGRIKPRRNEKVDLLREADAWLSRLASAVSGDTCPASVRSASVVLERRIADLATSSQSASCAALVRVLAAFGAAERALAKSFKWTTENYLQPLRGLSPRWIEQADDGYSEFRLASALASVRAPLGKESLWFRQHLEPLAMGSSKDRSWVNWADQPSNDVVWNDGDLGSVLNSILSRRLVRFEKAGTGGWGDIAARFARFDDIAAFIEGRVNEELLADLLWGIACVEHGEVASNPTTTAESNPATTGNPAVVPSAFYALLKLCHHRPSKGDEPIPLVPAILHRAMNGDGKAASELAARRLTASGCCPLVKSLPVGGDVARRTAAAVLFPISAHDFRLLKQSITRQPKEQTA
jgi:CRISPR-associated protein Csx17